MLLVPVAAAAALILPAVARADLADEQALADRFAPIVRLVAQEEECGPGEPYEPIDVELLFGENTVALRGPWNTTDLVKIGPAAAVPRPIAIPLLPTASRLCAVAASRDGTAFRMNCIEPR